MAKKRKEAAQSTTLDVFFKRGGNDANKKAKLRATEPAQAPSLKRNEKKPSFKNAPEDIIVIDDDEPRKPITVDDSSDIEVVEDTPAATPSIPRTAKEEALNVPTVLALPSTSSGQDAPYFTAGDLDMLFGEPSLLAGEQVSQRKRTEDGPDFGMPTLLHDGHPCSSPPSAAAPPLLPTAQNNTRLCLDGSYQVGAGTDAPVARIEQAHQHRPAPDPLQRSNETDELLREGTSYVHAPVANATSTDQWELGDDEAAPAEGDSTPDDPDEANVEFVLQDDGIADVGDAQATCPICNMLLDKLSYLVRSPTWYPASVLTCSCAGDTETCQ